MSYPASPNRSSGHPPAGRSYSPLAALLSYLVPGLGQLCQGRVGKGLLFMVCLYGMFFTGMYLGDWKNVYIPDTSKNNPTRLPPFVADIYSRPQYAGQFWIGIAAWPALWQYLHLDVPSAETSPFWHYFQHTPPESPDDIHKKPYEHWQGKSLTELQTDGDKTWDLGWVYTVIAGVLNILVIYDAFAGPAFAVAEPAANRLRPEGVPA